MIYSMSMDPALTSYSKGCRSYLHGCFDDVALVQPEIPVAKDHPVGRIQVIHGLLLLSARVPDVGCSKSGMQASAVASPLHEHVWRPLIWRCIGSLAVGGVAAAAVGCPMLQSTQASQHPISQPV